MRIWGMGQFFSVERMTVADHFRPQANEKRLPRVRRRPVSSRRDYCGTFLGRSGLSCRATRSGGGDHSAVDFADPQTRPLY